MRLYREQRYNPPWTVTSVLTQRNIPIAGRMSTECRNQKHFSSQYPHYNFGIIIIIIIYKTSWGDSSMVKIICCSSRGSEFCSENRLLTTPNCLEFYLQVEVFSALCWQWHTHSIYSIRYTQKLHLFKITIIYYFASFAIEICGEVFLHCRIIGAVKSNGVCCFCSFWVTITISAQKSWLFELYNTCWWVIASWLLFPFSHVILIILHMKNSLLKYSK